ncbi:putative non-specific serine/threonine protein kinase [Rosa chinensis]|uniref:Putative non-specific serine/threonine protein kinase n=2 Tax=Rosa chinensis TaxID=74649 RepID=A0A2P6PCH2_ROSCH|nr:putative non-specific serine/threonine protein kinase [Rosa chinensis]
MTFSSSMSVVEYYLLKRFPIPYEGLCSSLLVNHLLGEIPMELENITTLTYLSLEANQISGVVPPQLGSLIDLEGYCPPII